MRGIVEPDFLGHINGTMIGLTCTILWYTLRAWEKGAYTEPCEFKPDAVGGEPDPEPSSSSPDANMIRTTKDLFSRQTQTWADCPDFVHAVILDNICGTIRAKKEKKHSVRQERCERYTDDSEAGAAVLQSQASSQATRRPAHQIQTSDNWVAGASQASTQAMGLPADQIQNPSRRRIGTPVGQQDSQNDSRDIDLSFDFCQMPSAAHVLRLFGSDTTSADDSREVTRELSLNRTTSLSPSQRLSLSLDRIEPAHLETSKSKQRDMEQGRNGSVSEGK